MEPGRVREATIDLGALRANAALALGLAEGRALIAVVKADGYGHGAPAVARSLVEAGCRRLAVISVDEAVVLRDAGLASPEILVLSGLHDRAEAEEAGGRRLTPVVHGDESLSLAAEAGRRLGTPISVEVEVDTGMSRMGVAPETAVEFLVRVAGTDVLDLAGVFTHFSRADEADLKPCFEQLALFRRILASARERGVEPRSLHVANSAGLLAGKPILDALPEVTAVRPGLMLYGVRPAPHFDDVPLRPVMCLQARVVRLQELLPGQAVGYGGTFRVPHKTRIATLPLGYADGVPCAASGRGWVWLGGKRHPIAGRVSMDYIAIDLGWQDDRERVRLGDRAVIFGNGASDEAGISVEEAAVWAETIPYEPLVRVGQRVPRRAVDPAAAS
jgi:alanine racemase